MIQMLSAVASKFYFTAFQQNTDFGKRMSRDPREFRSMTKVSCIIIPDSHMAYLEAAKEAKADGIVCVTGSLYLVGEPRSKIKP